MRTDSDSKLAQRLLGIFVDQLGVFGYAVLLFGVAAGLMMLILGGLPDAGSMDPWVGELIGIVTLTIPVALYFYLAESGSRQASLGKRVAKVKVTNTAGLPATRRAVATRTIVKLLPWEIAHVCIHHAMSDSAAGRESGTWVMVGMVAANVLLMGNAMIVLFRQDRRGIHDLIAGTRICSVNKEGSHG